MMPKSVISLKRLVLALLVGWCLGTVTGLVGVWTMNYNEQEFGAAYSQYRFEWVALWSLPGLILSSYSGNDPDFQLGELYEHRVGIILLNSAFYAVTAVVVSSFYWVLISKKSRVRRY
jgi:hypothetical protein